MNYLYSYDPNSESARMLANELDIPRIRHTGSKFKGWGNTVINWGCSDLPLEVRRAHCVINRETPVARAINKRHAFECMAQGGIGARTVPFTFNRDVALDWMADGATVFARTRTAGKDGEGLVVCRMNDPLPEARLYTKMIQAEREYRITVVRDRVVARQRKVRLDDFTGVFNDDVKTSSNGYGFKWVTRGIPEDVEAQAIQAITDLELDFGGVDVIWDGQQAYVLEVNTAPELTPNSCRALAAALRGLLPQQ